MTSVSIGLPHRAAELRYIEQLNEFNAQIRVAEAVDDIDTWQRLVEKRSETVVAYRTLLATGPRQRSK